MTGYDPPKKRKKGGECFSAVLRRAKRTSMRNVPTGMQGQPPRWNHPQASFPTRQPEQHIPDLLQSQNALIAQQQGNREKKNRKQKRLFTQKSATLSMSEPETRHVLKNVPRAYLLKLPNSPGGYICYHHPPFTEEAVEDPRR